MPTNYNNNYYKFNLLHEDTPIVIVDSFYNVNPSNNCMPISNNSEFHSDNTQLPLMDISEVLYLYCTSLIFSSTLNNCIIST